MRCVRDFGKSGVWGCTPKKAAAFTIKLGCAASSAKNLGRGADVIATASSAWEPLLKGKLLKEGAQFNAVGAPIVTWREHDNAVVPRCIVIVDSRQACLNESGEVIQAGDNIHRRIAEVMAGTAKVDR